MKRLKEVLGRLPVMAPFASALALGTELPQQKNPFASSTGQLQNKKAVAVGDLGHQNAFTKRHRAVPSTMAGLRLTSCQLFQRDVQCLRA